MEDQEPSNSPQESEKMDVRSIVRNALEEYVRMEQSKTEPAYKVELVEERKRREQLERRLNELVDENRRSRAMAEEMERASAIRSELQKLGVTKVDLAFKAVREDIHRTADGRLVAKTDNGDLGMREYLTGFLSENPELLPGRIQGGSGAGSGHKAPITASTVDLDKIRPGMSPEDLDRVRQEIARIAGQTIRGA
jgi:succinate dehydrogenase/fumarate reductase flavoprotein subunit